MSWLWTIIFLCFAVSRNHSLSEAKEHEKKLSPAVVVGTVFCDTCFKQDFPKASHFIPGASVEVECKDAAGSTTTFKKETKTDSKGRFKIDLPFSVGKHVRRIKNCFVKLLRSNQPFCSVAATAKKSSSLRLKSRKQGVHVYSAGFFSFKPLNQPYVCDEKPSTSEKPSFFEDRKDFSPVITNPNNPTFLPPVQDPNSNINNLPVIGRYLPPLPQLPSLPPLPELPKLPSLPGIPFLPPKHKEQNALEAEDKKVTTQQLPFTPNPFNPIPNPLQPPPSLFPPNPLQPPPFLFPPNPFQPPPSVIPPVFPSPPSSVVPPLLPVPSPPPFFNFPPVPGFFPSPPPAEIHLPPVPGLFPSPPPSENHFPPFPFQPTPGFPGVPPANKESSSEPKTSNTP